MASPKIHLKEIQIYLLMGEEEDDDEYDENRAETIMNIIAEGTGNVEILQFHEYYCPPLFSFDLFISKNKSTLRSFSITCEKDGSYCATYSNSQLVREFRKCTALQEVTLQEKPPERTLKSFRLGGVHLRQPSDFQL